MMKKKVLVAYYEMFPGGSTTSLIAFLNCIDKEKYDVDLQLYHNKGLLLNEIPDSVNLLPDAALHKGKTGLIAKYFKGIFTGELFKAYFANRKRKQPGFSGQVLVDLQAKHLSRKSKTHYDYAIGFMEGWPNHYIAHKVTATKKYGWMHNTFANIAKIPELELPWMKKVDKIIFVADNCTEDFKKSLPEMADKAETILNITDSSIVKSKALADFSSDDNYMKFKVASCFKIVTACRISMYHKGLDRMVECAKKLKESGREFIWMIVGGGDQLDELKSLISQNDIDDCMFAVGNRLNPFPFIKEADLFCMLSRYEGKPMVITESMILGVPPLVANYLSAHEQINNGVDGIIVDNTDDSAFEPISYYMDNPKELQKLKDYLSGYDYGNSDYMRTIEEKYLN